MQTTCLHGIPIIQIIPKSLTEAELTCTDNLPKILSTTGHTNIREINILIANIDEGTLPDETKKSLKGQALFFRAYSISKW